MLGVSLPCSAIGSLRLDSMITVIVVAAVQFGKEGALGLAGDSPYLSLCVCVCFVSR